MKIFAALENDVGQGYVWLKKAGLPPRCIVKITNPIAKRSVFCEALQFETNFLKKYNQSPRFSISSLDSSIVMSGWYRARLGGLETQKDYPLEITTGHTSWGKLRACLHHPQIVVRVAAWLGLLSVALGGLGVVLGVVSLWPWG